MTGRLVLAIAFFVINDIQFNSEVSYEIEARSHDVFTLRGDWVGPVDEGQREEELVNPTENYGESADFPNMKRRKLKTKDKPAKRKYEWTEKMSDVDQKKKKNKRKRKKKKTAPRRFIKTTVAEKDKDSNMTESKEVTSRGKPVDIIVHIKMNE